MSSTVTAVDEEKFDLDLTQDVPEKQWPQPLRGLRYRVLIIYRLLFSLVGILNIGALVAIILVNPNPEWLGTLTAANLVTAVLVRQDVVINILYTVFCSMPKAAPLWMRTSCAKIYHLGGVHSGAGVCATAWLVASTVRSTIAYSKKSTTDSLATLVVSWLLSALLCTIVGFALPTFRKRHHNLFERLHRFLGWTALCLFWVRTVLSVYDSTPAGEDLGLALVRSPGFWMLGVATCSIASSWFFLRKVPVNAVPLSDHAIQLNFKYTVPVNGSFTRVSTRPPAGVALLCDHPSAPAFGTGGRGRLLPRRLERWRLDQGLHSQPTNKALGTRPTGVRSHAHSHPLQPGRCHRDWLRHWPATGSYQPTQLPYTTHLVYAKPRKNVWKGNH